MKRFRVLTVVLLCVFVYACNGGGDIDSANNNQAFLGAFSLTQHTTDELAISVPEAWVVSGDYESMVAFYALSPEMQNGVHANVSLIKEVLSGKFSVIRYKQAARDALRTSLGDVKFQQGEDNWHILEYTLDGNRVRQLQFFYIINRTAFTLTFTSAADYFDRQSQLFRAIERSLVLY